MNKPANTPIVFVLLCLLLLIGFTPRAGARQRQKSGTMEMHWQRMKTDPVYRKNRELLEVQTQKVIAARKQNVKTADDELITIPVVVHVVLPDPTVVSESQVDGQIEILNHNLAAQNADLADVPAPFDKLIGKMNIKLKLAWWQDYRGKWHAPITRTRTSGQKFTRDSGVMFESSGGHDMVRPG